MIHKYSIYRILKLSLFLAILLAQTAIAQVVTIKGVIYDKTTKEELPGASIIVKGTSVGAASDLDGNFILRNVESGRRTLIASYIGYIPDTLVIDLPRGGTVTHNFNLTLSTLKGKEIIVSAQAQGQVSAIQQQLTSNKIVNVVSEARIQELPDFNAAAAIGRLPGISTLQSSGESNKIVVRGLAPQYNQVTLGGVSLASTGSSQIGATSQGGGSGAIYNDRSVDLSMITPYMIKSISVYKSLTPDLNANSIGGTVNMELREAPSEFHTDFLWQSGYTAKSSHYGNYRAVASVSKRFFDDALGVYALGNIESYDRDADNMSAGYVISLHKVGANGYEPVKVSTVTLNRHIETRKRYGGNLILDYRLPSGSIKLVNMFSRLSSNFKDNSTTLNYQSGDLGFRYREGENNVDIAVNSINLTNDFGFMSMDLKFANNYSRNFLPSSPVFAFSQTQGVGSSTDNTTPENLLNQIKYKGATKTYLTDMSLFSSDYKENNQALKADFKVPFNFDQEFSGFLKVGGEYHYKHHQNAQETPYAGLRGGSPISNAMIAGIRANFPGLIYDGSAAEFTADNFTNLDSKINGSFLDDRFGGLLWAADPTLLNGILNYVRNTPQFSADSATSVNPGGWFYGYYQKYPNNYKYIEKYFAAYLMTELNIGGLMFVGGVRFEEENNLYQAYNLVDGRDIKSQRYYEVTTYPKNHFLLPMTQAKYSFNEWLDVRAAYTQTLARPDYHQLSPHYNMDYSRNNVWSGNPNLKPAQAYNHDLIITLHSNEIGLFSIGGFYKEVKNFTYATQYRLRASAPKGLDSLGTYNIGGVLPNTGAILYTYTNSPYTAYVRGIEIDFQTRLWYLPVPFDGIVLGINYTHISSSATYPWRDDRSDYSVRPPRTFVFDSTRVGRLINQPNDILNAYVGYDYKGFSARLSFIFQGNSTTYVGAFAEQDGFQRDYFRIDASVKQQLPWLERLETYLDLNNLNNRNNRSAQISIGGFTNEQNYGLTANLGVRYRM